MGNFLDEIKKASELSTKETTYSRKQGLNELKPACEPYIQDIVSDVKRRLLESARKGSPSHSISKILGKEFSHSPIFTAHVSFLYRFNKYIMAFQKEQMYAQCSDFLEDGYCTHSPDLLIYFISEINRRLKVEGIDSFYWEKTGRYWESMRKAIPTSYPTKKQRDYIIEEYEKYIKKTCMRVSYVGSLSFDFKVDAK